MQAKVRNNNRNQLENQSRFFQIIAKIGPKVVQKSTKNRSKIEQKSIKNRSKIVQNRGLEGSGAGLEASWAVLGDPKHLWRHLGPSWRRLGGVLEGSWSPLGRTWAEKGGQYGSNLAPKRNQNQLKIDPKIDQFFSGSWNRFLEAFWWIWDAKMKQS